MFPRWFLQDFLDQSSRLILWLTGACVGWFDLGSFNPIRARWIHHLLDNNFLASLVTANDISVPVLSSALCVDSFALLWTEALALYSQELLLRWKIRSEFKNIKPISEAFIPRSRVSGCQLTGDSSCWTWNCRLSYTERKIFKVNPDWSSCSGALTGHHMTENEGTHQTHGTGHGQGFYLLNLLHGPSTLFRQTSCQLQQHQIWLRQNLKSHLWNSLFSDQTSAGLMPQL